VTETKQPYRADAKQSHLWATSEEEARAAFIRKHKRQPRYVVPASLEGAWMAGPVPDPEGRQE